MYHTRGESRYTTVLYKGGLRRLQVKTHKEGGEEVGDAIEILLCQHSRYVHPKRDTSIRSTLARLTHSLYDAKRKME